MSINLEETHILYPPFAVLKEMFDMTGYLLSSGVVSPQNTPEGTFIVVFKDEPKYALRVNFSSHNVFCQDRRIPYET